MKSLSVAIQMKATAEQYFHVVLYIMPFKVVLTLNLLFIKLYDAVLTVECLVEILKCDHSNESC